MAIALINRPTANDYCANQNIVSGASLITNSEWMTIARNIEAQNSNWYNPNTTPPENKVGSGGLWRGHSDNIPSSALVASTDDNLGYEGTGNNINNGWQEKRTYTLSNGEIIWDFSRNMWELTSDTILGNQKPNTSSGSFWQQWTTISNFGTLSYDLTRPSNPAWNSTQNMGQYYAVTVTGTTTFAVMRGGAWTGVTRTGVFTMSLDFTPSGTYNGVGFRCVVR